METIEQAACSNCPSVEHEANWMEGFKAGALFAQRWIPIEEELPDDKQIVLSAPCENPKDSDIEKAMYIHGMFVSTHRTAKVRRDEHNDIQSMVYEREKLNDTTHWRPMKLK